jgi:hypothetical protein
MQHPLKAVASKSTLRKVAVEVNAGVGAGQGDEQFAEP